MAKLRHIALSVKDPEKTAQFYIRYTSIFSAYYTDIMAAILRKGQEYSMQNMRRI